MYLNHLKMVINCQTIINQKMSKYVAIMDIHRILGYLFYKTERLTWMMDTRMYSWHTPLILSIILTIYCADIALACLMTAENIPIHPYKGLADTIVWGFGIWCAILWIALHAYYHHKRRYLKIRQDKSYEKCSSIWAVLFLILPLVILIVLGHIADGEMI